MQFEGWGGEKRLGRGMRQRMNRRLGSRCPPGIRLGPISNLKCSFCNLQSAAVQPRIHRTIRFAFARIPVTAVWANDGEGGEDCKLQIEHFKMQIEGWGGEKRLGRGNAAADESTTRGVLPAGHPLGTNIQFEMFILQFAICRVPATDTPNNTFRVRSHPRHRCVGERREGGENCKLQIEHFKMQIEGWGGEKRLGRGMRRRMDRPLGARCPPVIRLGPISNLKCSFCNLQSAAVQPRIHRTIRFAFARIPATAVWANDGKEGENCKLQIEHFKMQIEGWGGEKRLGRGNAAADESTTRVALPAGHPPGANIQFEMFILQFAICRGPTTDTPNNTFRVRSHPRHRCVGERREGGGELQIANGTFQNAN
ncbi:hypothetical protein K227x_15580 [Rubripirellula lacrimiformis]|uniref:Uncharacterized protein n=1 Tax=Rubripirellula lacrimiformis TaxID=1930273 RepID=A0A517N7R0_9BACT|nr:hypothetical protein K227x_15580 [Rubripirellula lacrimiformis]